MLGCTQYVNGIIDGKDRMNVNFYITNYNAPDNMRRRYYPGLVELLQHSYFPLKQGGYTFAVGCMMYNVHRPWDC